MSVKFGLNARLMACAILLNLIFLANYLLWAISPPSGFLSAAIMLLLFGMILLLAVDARKTWLLLLFFAVGCLIALGTATYDEDARTIWLCHAKMIYLENNLYAQLNDYVPCAHNDYPVIFPALAATFAKVVGHWNEAFPKAVAVFFLMPPLIICLLSLGSVRLMTLFVIGLIVCCKGYLFNGYMDGLLSLYVCAIILYMIYFVKKKNVAAISIDRVLPGIAVFSFLAVAVLLKNEGLVIALCLALAMAFSGDRFQKRLYLISLTMALVFFLLTWKLFLMSGAVQNDLMTSGVFVRFADRLANPENSYLIVLNMLKKSGIGIILLALIFIKKNVTWDEFKIPVLFVMAYALALFFIYLSTPHDLLYHLDTSIRRTTMPINVVILGTLLFAFRVKDKSLAPLGV